MTSQTLTDDEIRRWQEQVLAPVVRGEPVVVEGELPGGGLALLSADADKIKEYVFESAKLPEIRGASMILDALNRDYPCKDFQSSHQPKNLREVLACHGLPCGDIDLENPSEGGCVVYAGGGSLLAVVPSALADSIQQHVEALYPRETGAATISCVWQPLTPADVLGEAEGPTYDDLLALRQRLSAREWKRVACFYQGNKGAGDEVSAKQLARNRGFGGLMALQSAKLRRRKQEKAVAPLFEAVPYARRCASCGKRPATHFLTEPEERYLCRVCNHKFRDGRELRRGWVHQFRRYWIERGRIVKVEVADDLPTIGKESAKSGYVGFIYADGDSIGAELERAATLTEYWNRSVALADAIEAAVYTALFQHLAMDDARIRPFEIITIGGEDALIIVPADAALPVATDVCRQFQEELGKDDRWNQKAPTMSAGVVIAHDDNPIYFLRELAEELLKSAKKRSYELADQGAVDFLILKSQSTLATNLRHLRTSPPLCLTAEETSERFFLTGRPYLLDEMDELMKTVQQLRAAGFSRSWLYSLHRMLGQGRLVSSVYYLYQYARLLDGAPTQAATLRAIHEQWGMVTDDNVPPWRKMQEQNEYTEYQTPWADFIEVLEFLP